MSATQIIVDVQPKKKKYTQFKCNHIRRSPERRYRPLVEWKMECLESRTLLSDVLGTVDVFNNSKISLAVADLDGDGNDDFVMANERMNRVVIELGKLDATGSRIILDQEDGVLAPRDV